MPSPPYNKGGGNYGQEKASHEPNDGVELPNNIHGE